MCLIAPATWAQDSTPMTGAEFDAYVKDRTLYYNNLGEAYGVEQYLPDRQVKWSFLDGQCKDGYWYEDGPFICFIYEDAEGDPQCWTFFNEPTGLRALFQDTPGQTELTEITEADEPMLCLGPDIGV
ncbi:hypothetical protein IV417_15735 [Alphaproteobacteria bacterium KMM 3653]|uniref:Uncharacterized protein n=1 Tax=Harenicola maris TaxID=2841044 RepID=A0AAP2G4Z9_9RHOB|nr:hypothetical protein [Harenicola maris]